jgi:hypothetical protein
LPQKHPARLRSTILPGLKQVAEKRQLNYSFSFAISFLMAAALCMT